MYKISPCKDCTNRHRACHMTCDDYRTWSAELKELKDYISGLRTKESDAKSRVVEVRRRLRKQYGR